ncbi:hypothetical protein BYT27DRAFT_7235831 [Phlegmacium glaucopus]|nr:hypothetical protein BYT27DRAFT_7235831 [Phlegmacium glaucopus]
MSSSSHSEQSSSSVPEGHIVLILLQKEESSFYLQIPLDIIHSLCLKPRKYLLFLGWCILGVEGVLALEHNSNGININGDLDDQVYYYVVKGLDLIHAVDIEVIKTRTAVPSGSMETRDQFRTDLLERDTCCVWTGIEARYGAGLHIIPHQRGSEWFQLIVENRPNYNEDVMTLRNINDIRNGIFANNLIHNGFDPRAIAILKTPNRILETRDVPSHHNRTFIPDNVAYPRGSRYTLQWLETPSTVMKSTIPNNSDATFKRHTRKPKPSDLLLHYNYGAAAIKNWGYNIKVLQNCTNPRTPHPHMPIPAPAGPSTTIHDRNVTSHKLEVARTGGADAGNSAGGAGTGLVESEGQVMWDEDEVILFFWGNSPAAKERYLKKFKENTQHMEQWREGLPPVSV